MAADSVWPSEREANRDTRQEMWDERGLGKEDRDVLGLVCQGPLAFWLVLGTERDSRE